MEKNAMNNTIKEIQRKYGEHVFRMAITHLFDIGVKHLKDADVEQTCQEILETMPKNSILTPELSADILRCSVEIAKLPIWDVLKFIKTDIEISGAVVHSGIIIEFRQNALGDLIFSGVVPADTDECTLYEIEESVNMKMEAYEKEHGSYYGFSHKDAIVQSFKEAGIRLTAPVADKTIYL